MSDELLRIEATDPRVWELTLRARLDADGRIRAYRIRCSLGCKLASVGVTDLGPLFFATWRPERIPDAEGRWNPNAKWSGRHPSSMALLDLPSDYPADYPDLLVRCEHGDAVLDRTELLERLARIERAPGNGELREMAITMGVRRRHALTRRVTDWPEELRPAVTREPFSIRVDSWINGFDNRA